MKDFTQKSQPGDAFLLSGWCWRQSQPDSFTTLSVQTESGSAWTTKCFIIEIYEKFEKSSLKAESNIFKCLVLLHQQSSILKYSV